MSCFETEGDEYTCVCLCMICINMCVCVCVFMYVHVCACMCVCVYVSVVDTSAHEQVDRRTDEWMYVWMYRQCLTLSFFVFYILTLLFCPLIFSSVLFSSRLTPIFSTSYLTSLSPLSPPPTLFFIVNLHYKSSHYFSSFPFYSLCLPL